LLGESRLGMNLFNAFRQIIDLTTGQIVRRPNSLAQWLALQQQEIRCQRR